MTRKSMDIKENLKIGSTRMSAVVTTCIDGVTAMTGIHRKDQPWRQGGVRFVKKGSVEELAHLARGMTEKAIAANVPIDGMKGLIVCPDGVPGSTEQRADILFNHMAEARKYDDCLIYGPDMACQEDVLDILFSKYGMREEVTGLSRDNGGMEIDKNAFTAYGLTTALEYLCQREQQHYKDVVIQGFGAVGANVAHQLFKRGYRIIGVSNIHGGLVNSNGLDIESLYRLWQDNGDQAILDFAEDPKYQNFFYSNPDEIYNVKAEVFVPSARTSVIALKEEINRVKSENPTVREAEAIMQAMAPKVILEGANRPLTPAAEHYLSANGVYILPDILVNCGGMIGCCYEYKHRKQVLAMPNQYSTHIETCLALIRETVRNNMTELLDIQAITGVFDRRMLEKILGNRKGPSILD